MDQNVHLNQPFGNEDDGRMITRFRHTGSRGLQSPVGMHRMFRLHSPDNTYYANAGQHPIIRSTRIAMSQYLSTRSDENILVSPSMTQLGTRTPRHRDDLGAP